MTRHVRSLALAGIVFVASLAAGRWLAPDRAPVPSSALASQPTASSAQAPDPATVAAVARELMSRFGSLDDHAPVSSEVLDRLAAMKVDELAALTAWLADASAGENVSPRLLAVALEYWAAADPHAAVQAAIARQGKPAFRGGQLFAVAMQALARRDPAAVKELSSTLSSPASRGSALTAYLSAMGGASEEALLEALVGPNGEMQDIPAAVARKQPLAALKALGRRPFTMDATDPSVAWTAWAMGRRGLTAALSQLDDALPGPAGRVSRMVATRLVSDACRSDPATALGHLDRLSSPERTKGLATAMQSWVATDPAAATAWAKSRAPGFERDSAITQLFAHNANLSPAEAEALTGEFQAVPKRLAAVEALGKGRHQKQPADALEWVGGFADPDLKLAAERGIVSSWAQQDAIGATAFAFSKTEGPEKGRLVKSVAASLWLPDFSPEELRAFRQSASTLPESDQRLLIRESVDAKKDSIPAEYQQMLKSASPAQAFDAIENFAKGGFRDPFGSSSAK